MTAAISTQKASKKAATRRPPATTGGQRRAAVILEVLAGIRTTREAAEALGTSVNNYYIVERKALAGLVAACEPAPRRGPTLDLQRQVERLQRALAQCQRESQRQAALVRATQRAVGLPVVPERAAPPTTGAASRRPRKGKADSGKRRRRHSEPRAARVARALQKSVAQTEALEVQPTLESQRSEEHCRCAKEDQHHDSLRT